MKEEYGDIWGLALGSTICISTNGDTNKHGEAVMGRGLAFEAKQRYPQFPAQLGYRLRVFGNVLNVFSAEGQRPMIDPNYRAIITLPVKHHWHERADPFLIYTSLTELVTEVLDAPNDRVYLTRIGCGNGGLDWETVVKPTMQKLLKEDRFIVVEKSE